MLLGLSNGHALLEGRKADVRCILHEVLVCGAKQTFVAYVSVFGSAPPPVNCAFKHSFDRCAVPILTVVVDYLAQPAAFKGILPQVQAAPYLTSAFGSSGLLRCDQPPYERQTPQRISLGTVLLSLCPCL